MTDDSAANWFVRLMACAVLVGVGSGVVLLGVWTVADIAKDAVNAPAYLYTTLLCLVLALYALGLVVWRVLAWQPAKQGGNLLPWPVMVALVAPLVPLALFGAWRAVVEGKPLHALGLASSAFAAMGLLGEVRERAAAAKPRRDPTVSR